MNEDLRIRQEDLLTNPTHRVAVGLCLDVSDSMSGAPVEELNAGVNLFFDALLADPVAKASAEVAIVAFAEFAGVKLDFQSVDRVSSVPILRTKSELGLSTNLGGGAALTIDLLEQRKSEYRAAGVDYFQPFFVLMTDGRPTTDEHFAAASRVVELETARKLAVMPIGIGPHADMAVLAAFSKKNQPLRLQGLKFNEFFKWLSQSIVRVSQSRPGETVPLAPGIKGWADVG